MRTVRAFTAAILIALATASPPALAQGGGCMSNREGHRLVQQQQVVPFPEAVRRAGLRRNQIVGQPQLCRGGGGYVYRVDVLERGRDYRTISIPAN